MSLESEAVESRQVHFEHDARRAGVRHARQILLGIDEELDGVVLLASRLARLVLTD